MKMLKKLKNSLYKKYKEYRRKYTLEKVEFISKVIRKVEKYYNDKRI